MATHATRAGWQIVSLHVASFAPGLQPLADYAGQVISNAVYTSNRGNWQSVAANHQSCICQSALQGVAPVSMLAADSAKGEAANAMGYGPASSSSGGARRALSVPAFGQSVIGPLLTNWSHAASAVVGGEQTWPRRLASRSRLGVFCCSASANAPLGSVGNHLLRELVL